MKKVLKSIMALAVILGFSTQAQAQIEVEEGNFIADVYYGGPNLYTAFLKAAAGTDDEIKVGGAGPFGFRAEYMLADQFGVGIDFHYTTSSLNYSTLDPFTNETYDYDVTSSRIVALLMFNYHFYSTDNLDVYFAGGAGYRNRTIKVTTNDPIQDDFDEFNSIIPVGARIAIGARYFFTDNIGLNAAFGFGGPLISGGLSFKL